MLKILGKLIFMLESTSRNSTIRTETPITTSSETVLLSRSSRERSVSFHRPRGSSPDDECTGTVKAPTSRSNSQNTLSSSPTIGPNYGTKASPPVGVYLSKKEFGSLGQCVRKGRGGKIEAVKAQTYGGLRGV